MPKKKSGPERCEHQTTPAQASDPKPVAALRLGFHSRYVGLDWLHEAITVLHDEIHPNAFSGLLGAIQQVDQSIRGWEEKPDPLIGINRRRRQQRRWTPDFILASTLCSMAEVAIAPESPYRKWYDLGAGLGDCLGQEASKSSEHQAILRVRDCIKALPSRFLRDSGLGKLAVRASDTSKFGKLLDQVLRRLGNSKAPPQKLNPANSPIIKVVDAIERILRRLPVAAGSIRDDATEERNEWIYAECCKRTPYKAIIRMLSQKPASWDRITTFNGIKAAARRYAEAHRKPPPPMRRSGRPKDRT
jgi:hypothetical protein